MTSGESFEIFQSAVNQYCEEIEKFMDCYVDKILQNHPNASESPIIVNLLIDYEKWSAVPEWKLALDTLLDEPLQSQKDIEACVWVMCYSSLVQRYSQYNSSLQLNQIHCIIRFRNLPLDMAYEFVPFRHPVRLSLSFMKCVLYSFGDCCTLLRQTIWHCPKQCASSKNFVFNAEHSNVNNGKIVNKCLTCNEILEEYEHRRSTYMCRWIQVFNAEHIETPVQYGKLYRDVRVKLSDELCNVKLVLGDAYLLIGTFDIFTQTYISWNFEKIEKT